MKPYGIIKRSRHLDDWTSGSKKVGNKIRSKRKTRSAQKGIERSRAKKICIQEPSEYEA